MQKKCLEAKRARFLREEKESEAESRVAISSLGKLPRLFMQPMLDISDDIILSGSLALLW